MSDADAVEPGTLVYYHGSKVDDHGWAIVRPSYGSTDRYNLDILQTSGEELAATEVPVKSLTNVRRTSFTKPFMPDIPDIPKATLQDGIYRQHSHSYRRVTGLDSVTRWYYWDAGLSKWIRSGWLFPTNEELKRDELEYVCGL